MNESPASVVLHRECAAILLWVQFSRTDWCFRINHTLKSVLCHIFFMLLVDFSCFMFVVFI